MHKKIINQEELDTSIAKMKTGDTLSYHIKESEPYLFYITKIPSGFIYETLDGHTVSRPVFVPEK